MYDLEKFEKEQEQREIDSAKVEIVRLKAVRILLSNNDLACEIHISGLEVGISLNEKLIPIIDYEIEQIEKFLKEEPNTYSN